MSIHLPLESMTTAEKLEAMEAIWADLSKPNERLPIPAWHGEVLEERRNLVQEGKLKFLDLETAMADLRKEVRENPTP